jgi:hypothetical protein
MKNLVGGVLYLAGLALAAFLLMPIAQCTQRARERSYQSYVFVPDSRWIEVPLDDMKVKYETSSARLSGLKVRVDYYYTVNGVGYRGRHFDPERDLLIVGEDVLRRGLAEQLRTRRTGWYDSESPQRSVLLRMSEAPRY